MLISPNDLLFGLRSWSGEHAELRPAWHMLTGCNSPSTVVGYAFNNITCRAQMQTGYNVGYSQHIGSFTWMVMAHEVRAHATGRGGRAGDRARRADALPSRLSARAPAALARRQRAQRHHARQRCGLRRWGAREFARSARERAHPRAWRARRLAPRAVPCACSLGTTLAAGTRPMASCAPASPRTARPLTLRPARLYASTWAKSCSSNALGSRRASCPPRARLTWTWW